MTIITRQKHWLCYRQRCRTALLLVLLLALLVLLPVLRVLPRQWL